MQEDVYAQPRDVDDLKQCFFYHVMELPDVGVVGEQWDLRDTVDQYLGNVDFRDRRVLDVGTASGYLTFEIERRGGTVVSFDLGPNDAWDMVPYQQSGYDIEEQIANKRRLLQRLINAYWFAHAQLHSQAKAAYGNVYQIPEALGEFDVVVLGSILLHLQDPFQALQSAAKRSSKLMIITDMFLPTDDPIMRFLPDGRNLKPADTWWLISEGCIERMLGVLGFSKLTIQRHDHKSIYDGQERYQTLSTCIAGRVPE
jgi:SAM-dependent methyltransferase